MFITKKQYNELTERLVYQEKLIQELVESVRVFKQYIQVDNQRDQNYAADLVELKRSVEELKNKGKKSKY